MKSKSLCILSLFLLMSFGALAQQAPFWEEIQNFKKQDSLQMPSPEATLFVGSSSIRLWKNLAETFPNHEVINRGFGGSTLKDLLYYMEDIVLPYHARQIVIYSGENDIATGTVSAEETLTRFKQVVTSIRTVYPKVPILFISIKPSPSRIKYIQKMDQANQLIKAYAEGQEHTGFVDVFHPMLDSDHQPKADIFVKDRLHMNLHGYKIWQKALAPFLIK